MIDFGDLDTAEEVSGLKTVFEAEQTAWEEQKAEKRRLDERQKEQRLRRARVSFAATQSANALRAQAAEQSPTEATPAGACAGTEERKKKYKWLLSLDEETLQALKSAEEQRKEAEERKEPAPEDEGTTCWQIICAMTAPEGTDMKTLKSRFSTSDLFAFGPPRRTKRSSRRTLAATPAGLSSLLGAGKPVKHADDTESTADLSEISTAYAAECSDEDLELLSDCNEECSEQEEIS
mmetsp:Transcript_56223/g.130998  ORF Transcript_56223/g.130998 Transcript_56223/m.130998 type:complete len:236 (-) Transcript_56223:99-806(-)